MAEQQARRSGSAKMADVVEFFTSASEQAKQVIEYFRQADPAEAAAALAVASSLMKGRTPQSGAPRGRKRKADGAAGDSGASATPAQGSATSTRVVGGGASAGGGARTGRVIGGGTAETEDK